jgi:hypothetical protein
MEPKIYTPVWSKYRPAILRMMIDSLREPQSYQLSNHEFKAMNPKQKGGYTFELEVAKGKAVSGLKDSVVARDLWEILQMSPKATELISASGYQFSMDKQFRLHVNNINNQ